MTGHTDMPRLAHMPKHYGALSTALVASGQGLGLARGGQVWPSAPTLGHHGVVGQGIASSWSPRHPARPSHDCVCMGTGVRRARLGGGGTRAP